MTDRFQSRQVHADDGGSDDHVIEEGRHVESILRTKRGGSVYAIDIYIRGCLPLPSDGRYSTLCIQEVTGLRTSSARGFSPISTVLCLSYLCPFWMRHQSKSSLSVLSTDSLVGVCNPQIGNMPCSSVVAFPLRISDKILAYCNGVARVVGGDQVSPETERKRPPRSATARSSAGERNLVVPCCRAFASVWLSVARGQNHGTHPLR